MDGWEDEELYERMDRRIHGRIDVFMYSIN